MNQVRTPIAIDINHITDLGLTALFRGFPRLRALVIQVSDRVPVPVRTPLSVGRARLIRTPIRRVRGAVPISVGIGWFVAVVPVGQVVAWVVFGVVRVGDDTADRVARAEGLFVAPVLGVASVGPLVEQHHMLMIRVGCTVVQQHVSRLQIVFADSCRYGRQRRGVQGSAKPPGHGHIA